MSKHSRLSLVLAGCVALAACSAAELQSVVSTAQQDVVAACNDATAIASVARATLSGGDADTAANIGAYVQGTCNSATAIAAVANSPTGLQWLGQLQGMLEALVHPAGG